MAQRDNEWRVRDVVAALVRHKKKSFILSLTILAAGALVILYFPRTYRSEAKVFLQRGRETVGLDPTATTGQTVSLMQSDRDDEIQSAMDILRSRSVLAKAVDLLSADLVLGKLDAATKTTPNAWADAFKRAKGSVLGALRSIDPVPDAERALIELVESLEIDAQRNSTVLDIRYDAKSPELAQRVLQGVLAAYREEHASVFRNEKSSQFFDEQRALLKSRLEQAADALRQAKDRMGLASITARSQTLEEIFSGVNQSHYAALQELATSRAHVESLERQLGDLPEREMTAKRSVPNEGADMLRDQLYQLQVKQSDLQARYSASHPLVLAIGEQVKEAETIVAAQALVREETTDDINPMRRELLLQYKRERSLLAGLEARNAELTQQLAKIQAETLALNKSEAEILQLQRDHDLAQASFLQYAENFEQARINQEMEASQISNLSFFQEPTLNHKPISPSKLLVALASLALSIFAPIALALSCERADQRLRRMEEIETALNVPVLASFESEPHPDVASPQRSGTS